MTSRVQKGGPVFKPVAKARARATSTAPRQTSTAPAERRNSIAPTEDVPSSNSIQASTPVPTSSMPPPTFVPFRAPEPDAFSVTDSQPEASSSRLRSEPPPVASGSRIQVPPVIAAKLQPRQTPAPPIIVSRPAAAPVIQQRLPPPRDPTPDLVNRTLAEPLLNEPQLPSQDEFIFPDTLSQFVEPSSTITPDGPSTSAPPPDASTSGPSPDNTVKKKLRKRKKKSMAESDGDATETDAPVKPKPSRKKRAKKDDGETSDGTEPKPKKKRKAKAKADTTDEESTPVKKRRKKSQPIFDLDADPGEDIDPTVVTMAELCVDSGQGRISSKAIEIQKNHLAWKEQSKEKRARMKALAEQKKYGRPEDTEEQGETAPAAATEPSALAVDDSAPDNSGEVIIESSGAADAEPAIADASGQGFDYSRDLTRSRFTVQVRIGPNGETIIDEESLTVDRQEEPDTSNYTHVVESDNTKFINSASYTKKCRGSRWSAEETEMFFDALAQHGENYELISLVLPGRSRTACKNKFKAEDKKDSARITRCLESRTPIDMSTLARLTGRDFSGPTPIIKMPTPPPAPEPTSDKESEPGPATPRRKRSRSRSRTAALEGVQIIGDADSYQLEDGFFAD
ncbi:HTH myb-type domain-containing protein [Favolaschia claudopus]|uniref:HTH myb-type domain-containing protein n=1 Tax=Favolaschia claudopus TaxID=2862362 RepID=A0AAW0EEH5_9AGAR